jgi:hypothetical protein
MTFDIFGSMSEYIEEFEANDCTESEKVHSIIVVVHVPKSAL